MVDQEDYRSDFPIREEVEDFSGKLRKFIITCHEAPLGFSLCAEEEGKEGNGFEFRAFSEMSPYNALGRLRQKMYRALATRYITGKPGDYRMLHDSIKGRITSDNDGGALLIIDGIPLSMDEFERILRTHEGWSFTLNIKDSFE